jgi:hypothetical protein
MPDWLRDLTPRWLHGPLDWVLDSTVLGVTAAISALLFLLSLVGIPWLVTRVPKDYFSRPEPYAFKLDHHPPAWRTTLKIAKNLLGVLLLALGIAMFVLPGQGLITVAISLLLIDFPGKRSLERRIVAWPPVFRTINRMRRRAGKPPLELPQRTAT